MKIQSKFLMASIVTVLILCSAEKSFGGVRQSRAVNSNRTNIGTNPYADMEANPDTGYGYVNPNYSNQQIVYPEAGGQVAVDPYEVAADPNGNAVYNGYNTLAAGNYYDNYGGSTGAGVPGIVIQNGAVFESIPSSAVPLMVKGTRYYYDSNYNLFCMEVFDGGAILYQVVPPPLGAVVTTLPAGCLFQYINGKPLSVCGNTIFKQVAGGYEVVSQ